ncbi:MAG: cyclodeaminase/cyclohydrolase family protein [Defluviitaleaceae bacterium]|nr:cyclodeaminase/cyclohydrolase family protein [Defluviitaleaceae bacterium]
MLTELNLKEFVDKVASDSPAPGGGSIAAVTAAQGIALTHMVTLLTIGKKKYEEHDNLMKEISAEAKKLMNELVEYVDKDTEAYNAVSAVFAMPKETDDEKAARSAAMQSALKAATLVPFEVMSLATRAIIITEKAIGKSNINAVSDLGVALLNINAGVNAAWLNVKINLSGIKDEDFVDEYMQKGGDFQDTSSIIATRAYKRILEAID